GLASGSLTTRCARRFASKTARPRFWVAYQEVRGTCPSKGAGADDSFRELARAYRAGPLARGEGAASQGGAACAASGGRRGTEQNPQQKLSGGLRKQGGLPTARGRATSPDAPAGGQKPGFPGQTPAFPAETAREGGFPAKGAI